MHKKVTQRFNLSPGHFFSSVMSMGPYLFLLCQGYSPRRT